MMDDVSKLTAKSVVTNWPPDYKKIMEDRIERLSIIKKNPSVIPILKDIYKKNPDIFINHWCVTQDPRNIGDETKPTTIPFILFPRQEELLQFYWSCIKGKGSGLVEKSRAMGATWLGVSFSVWMWLFNDGSVVGWGSRKEKLVDEIGVMDSIFEKIRFTIRNLPDFLLPSRFVEKDHMLFEKIINPNNLSTIIGEGGDNIGRGGRSSIYFCDESAHYERAEKISAALSATTNTMIDISSVNGIGNLFHRKREAGVEWHVGEPILKNKTNVFVMDWSENPFYDMEWFTNTKNKFIDEGQYHIFAQEYERRYEASKEAIVIPADWLIDCIGADKKLGLKKDDFCGNVIVGMDPADQGIDSNGLVGRRSSLLLFAKQSKNNDIGEFVRESVEYMNEVGVGGEALVMYDCVGVGASIRSESNRLEAEGKMPGGMSFTAWSASFKVQRPFERIGGDQGIKNKDFYNNLKAQAWWELRIRVDKTRRMVRNPDMYDFDIDELFIIPDDMDVEILNIIKKELCQPTYTKAASTLKLQIEKAPNGTKSPNIGDSIVMAYCPIISILMDDSYAMPEMV